MKTYKVGEFAELLGVHVKTLQAWDKDGVLKAFRTPTGRRYYTEEQYKRYMLESNGKVVAYCRINFREQKELLEAQKEALKKYFEGRGEVEFQVVCEVGDGMDFEREEFRRVLMGALSGDIKEIVVVHSDRFVLAAFELIKDILGTRGVKLTDLGNSMYSSRVEKGR